MCWWCSQDFEFCSGCSKFYCCICGQPFLEDMELTWDDEDDPHQASILQEAHGQHKCAGGDHGYYSGCILCPRSPI